MNFASVLLGYLEMSMKRVQNQSGGDDVGWIRP